MSTNYFVRVCDKPCPHCAAEGEGVHLGQSAGGWRFLLHADPEWPHEEAFTEWLRLATSGAIYDEYGKPVTIGELLALIHGKRDQRSRQENGGMDVFTVDGHEFSTRWFR